MASGNETILAGDLMNEETNVSELLEGILGDPAKLQQIMEVAQSLMGAASDSAVSDAGGGASTRAADARDYPGGAFSTASSALGGFAATEGGALPDRGSVPGGGTSSADASTALPAIASILGALGATPAHSEPHDGITNEDRIRLLEALIPFLGEHRRDTARLLIRILRLTQVADLDKLLKG